MSEFDDFRLPPLMNGDWLRLDAEELALAVGALDETPEGLRAKFGLRRPPVRGRAVSLPFYGPGWALVDLEAETRRDAFATAFVVGPGRTVLVDGTSPPIHQLNHDLALKGFASEDHAEAYLKFFCGTVWGDGGPFAVVGTATEAGRWLASPFDAALVRPTLAQGKEGGDFRFSATVVYQAHLFASAFRVQEGGMIEMTDDEPLFEGETDLVFEPPHRSRRGVRP